MPPTLLLVRHAEAEHNATENWDLPDPSLTAHGHQQCLDLQSHLRSKCAFAADVELIITSPLRRTLQTTLLAVEWLINDSVRVEVDAMWHENSDSPCDTGSDIETLVHDFPSLDFTTVDPIFPSKGPNTRYAFTRSTVLARGRSCLEKLYSRSEKVIAIVSHSSFLRTAIAKRRFANADFRVFYVPAGVGWEVGVSGGWVDGEK